MDNLSTINLCKFKLSWQNEHMAELIYYCGTMDSGKSTLALQTAHNHRSRGREGVIFTSKDRAGKGLISSRLGLQIDALEVDPELFAGCSEAVSEVGGFSVTISGGHRLYLVEAAQKGIAWIKLSAKGTAGHGSFINRDNAVTKVSDAVSRIGNYQWPQLLTKTTAQFFKKIAELTGDKFDPKNVQPLLNHLGNAVKMLGATISNTANPTMLEAGYKANVIPQNASAVIDGRFLPGYENDLHETIKKLAGDEIEVEVLTRDIALEAEFAGPLVEAMCKAINVEDSAGIPVPYLMSGGTDNKALHDLGIVGYGFSPLRLPEDLDFFALFHGVDERVPIDGLKFGVRVLYEFLENI